MAPPLVLVAVAWVIGLLIAHAWLVPYAIRPGIVALLCILPVGAILLWWRDKSLRLAGFCTLAFLLGALRYQRAQPGLPGPDRLAYYNDAGWVTADGVISGYPDRRDTSALLSVDVTNLQIAGQTRAVQGTLLAQTARFPEYEYGDRVRLCGLLKTPPDLDGFPYRQYLARRGIYSILERPKIELLSAGEGKRFWALLYCIRDHLRRGVARLMAVPESSLLQGILLGIRSEIPRTIYDEFNATSTSHLLVISGANVVVVTALLAGVLGRLLGRAKGYWVTIAGLAVYVLLVGAETPVVRAGVMGGLYLTGRHLGRRATAYVSLCAAALGLTALNPLALWDASFQLSFVATAGLILLADPLERFMDEHLWKKVKNARLQDLLHQVGAAIAVTLAPQVMVLPIIATSFGRLSLVSPLANLLVGPVQPLIMTWGLAAALTGLCPWLLPLARVVAWVPWLLLAYTRSVVHWMSGWPSASVAVTGTTAFWLTVGTYGCLVLLVLVRRRGHRPPNIPSLIHARPGRGALGVATVIVVLLGLTIRQLPDRRLHVAFLDVGQGDAILITTPRGHQVLVDGGPSPAALLAALGQEMPFWDHSIDLVVLTHADRDHSAGLVAVLERYNVGGWIDNGLGENEPIAEECLRRVEQAGVERHITVAGDRFELGEGVSLEVLNPQEEETGAVVTSVNNASVVLLLRHGSNAFLLTGDIEAKAEHDLIRNAQQLQADVLKVAHHGSGGATTQEFLAAVDPAFAVVSVGKDNSSGHPAPETLERLASMRDLQVIRTDLQGTVEFRSDGRQLWVQTQR